MDNLINSSDASFNASVALIERGGEPAPADDAGSDKASDDSESISSDLVVDSEDVEDNEVTEEAALDDVDDAEAAPDAAPPRKYANRFEGDDADRQLEKAYVSLVPEYTRSRQEVSELRKERDALRDQLRTVQVANDGIPDERMNQLLADSEREGVDINTLIWMEKRDAQTRTQMQQQQAQDSLMRYVESHEVQQDPELRTALFEAIGRDADLMNLPVWMPADKQAALCSRTFDLLVAEEKLKRYVSEQPAREAALRKVIEAEYRERRGMKRVAAPVSAQRSTPAPTAAPSGDPDVAMLNAMRGNAHGLW